MKAKLIKKSEIQYDLMIDTHGLYTSTYQWTSNGNLLSLKNCQSIERGYDLDELAIESSKEYFIKPIEAPIFTFGYEEGFQKALELIGDKKFTEEDIIKAIEFARNGSMQEQHNGYGRPTELRFVLDNISSDEIIKSLQQTEWDCTFNPEEKDSKGCLILKRL